MDLLGDYSQVVDIMEKNSLSYRITEQINTIFDKLKELNADRRTIEMTRRKMLLFVQDVVNSQVERINNNYEKARNYDENWVGALVDVGKLLYSIKTGAIGDIATEAGKTFGKKVGGILLNQVKGTPGSTPISSISVQQEVGMLFANLFGEGELSRTLGRVFGGIADGFNKLFTGETGAEKYKRQRMDFIRKLQGEWNALIERRTADLLKTTSMEGYYANTSFEGYLKTRGAQGRLTGGNLDYYKQYLAGQPTEGQALPQNIPTTGFGIGRLGETNVPTE